ncbi:MAG: hypothetical protein KKC14_03735 [Alphaproteobacteria bacterium]|nr:hypothetical protein [Alphaproteobacteria bacterium]
MGEATNDLIFEVLKAIQHDVAQVRLDVRELKAELQAMRGHMLATHQDVANVYLALDRQDGRLNRIERRLELAEPAL